MKRSTPINKVALRKVTTPVNRKSNTSHSGSSLRSSSATTLSKWGSVPNICAAPTITGKMPLNDEDLNCDLIYSDYLQAFTKRLIIADALEKNEEDINDQLIIQRDTLYKSKLKYQDVNKRAEEVAILTETDELLTNIERVLIKFEELSKNFDLFNTMQKLIEMLKNSCTMISFKNVKELKNQEEVDKLIDVLEKCLLVCKKIDSQKRNTDEIKKLSLALRRMKKNQELVVDHQASLNDYQKKTVSKMLKSLSDMYAAKE